MSKLGINEANGHLIFLEDLVRKEQRKAYQTEDFLSTRWQQDLWEGVASIEKSRFASKSPSSVIPSAPQATPSDLCVDWREKICEWKYKVVDCFDLDREVVSISMFFLDKYLEKHFVNEEVSWLSNHSHLLAHHTLTLPSIFFTLSLTISDSLLVMAMSNSFFNFLQWHASI